MATTEELLHIHAVVSYVFLGMSLILNPLVLILVRKTEKLDSFRFVFYAHCFADMLFAVAFSISLMYYAHLPKIILFFPTGPLAYFPILTPIAFQLQSMAYVFILCLVCSTFLHRYKLVNRISTSRTNLPAILDHVLYVPVLQWLLTSAFLMKPDHQLRTRANLILGSKYGLDFENIYLIGVDVTEFSNVNPLLIISTLLLFIEISAIFIVMLRCGVGIHRFIKSSVASEKLKRMQRHVLRMLVFQVIHPIILLLSPSLINFAQLIFDFQFSEEINLFVALCFALYPVTNPLLSLIQSKELKASLSKILRKLFLRNKSEAVTNVGSLHSSIGANA